TDGSTIRTAVNNLRASVPQKGTSLINAFKSIQQLDPAPDNIFLLTDGLPTQGKRIPSRETMVKPEQRARYFAQALRELPPIPVNVLLFPMDGDPFAAEAYWTLAIRSKGSFMAPSRDWP
nr:VWA domain-containing protein [Gammaproteobacteria bacterium]